MPLESVADPSRWNGWLAANAGHVLQTAQWGTLKEQFGWRAERLWWRDGNEVRGGAQVLYRRLAPTLTLAYVPRGPIVSEPQALPPLLERLQLHVRARGAFLLKLELDHPSDPQLDALLRASRFVPTAETIQPPATIHIDLRADLDTILARMKPKWRYNIRLAEKKEVRVREGGAADLDAFVRLMQETGARDHFAIHSADYYAAVLRICANADLARLFIAEYAGSPLAMIFVTGFAGEAIYLYGASSNAERSRMPNHALHWAAIQWAKARGCARYDLWGIPSAALTEGEASALPSSLYQFKQGFGGTIIRYTGAWDAAYSPLKHTLYRQARQLRRAGTV